MRFLFVRTIGQGATIGGLTRILAIAETLTARGHTCAVYASEQARSMVAAAGLALYPSLELPRMTGRSGPPPTMAHVMEGLGFADPAYLSAAVAHERQAIRSFRPDVAYADFAPTAPISARLEGVPIASVAQGPFTAGFRSSLFPGAELPAGAADPYNRFLDAVGCEPVTDPCELLYARSDLHLVPSGPRLDEGVSDSPRRQYVGHLIGRHLEEADVPDWLTQLDPTRPTIFMYFSFSYVHPWLYERVVPAAFDGTEFQVVVATGSHPLARGLREQTPNVRFTRFVPGRAMLARSDIAVIHGGQNTVVNSQLSGVPAMVFPGQHLEWHYHGTALERAGTGLCLGMEAFEPVRLLERCREMLSHNGYRRQAVQLGESLRQLGGPDRAAQLLVALGRGAPAMTLSAKEENA